MSAAAFAGALSAKGAAIEAKADPEPTKTIYFINGWNWAEPHYHIWNSEGDLDEWPGYAASRVDGISVAADVYGDNDYDTTWYGAVSIWKAVVPADAENIIFNGDGRQTGDLSAVDGAIYSFKVNGKFFDVVDLLLTTKDALEAVEGTHSYKGNSYSNSVCNIDDGRKAAILNKYNTLIGNGDSKVVDSAKQSLVSTNDISNPGNNTDVKIEKIADALNGFPNSPAAAIHTLNHEDSKPLVITVATLGITAALGVGLIALRRKSL